MSKRAVLKFSLLVLLVLLAFFGVNQYEIFNNVNVVRWQDGIQNLGIWAPIGFILLYTIGTIVFLPGTIFTLIGGAAFGVFWGSILGIIAATCGALGAHFTARLLGKDFIDSLVMNNFKRLHRYNNKIASEGFLTILILRLTPFIPYNILNLALAYSPVKTRDYTLATAAGIAPGIIAYVYLGEAVATLSLRNIIFGVFGILLYMVFTAALVWRVRQARIATK